MSDYVLNGGCTLVVWDDESMPPNGIDTVALWQSFSCDTIPDAISIPKLVEDQADVLKARYLGWLYELGEKSIQGRRLVDHLDVRPGFSYWWMTLLAEKSSGKTPRIYDAIRLFALEGVVKQMHVNQITLISHDMILAETFQKWCLNAGLIFYWKPSLSRRVDFKVFQFKRYLDLLLLIIRVPIIFAKYLFRRWPLIYPRKGLNISTKSEVIFIDCLIHLNQSAFATGRFASNYWTGLISLFPQVGKVVRWLHIFVPHEEVKTAKQARDLIAQFNHSSHGSEFHDCLDRSFSFLVAFYAMRDYGRLVWRCWRLRKIRYSFIPNDSFLDLWPLFKKDWFDSLLGSTSVWNCLNINLWEKALTSIPHQEKGVYLQENQAWEMAFIYAWKASAHGELIGVPHATVRYWDLRYFQDKRNYIRQFDNSWPMPDKVALNGPVAISAYHSVSYPDSQIVEVEALRYSYINSKGNLKRNSASLHLPLRVLVCGDILPKMSRQMMQWLVLASQSLPTNIRYILKPHPACSISISEYTTLGLSITNAPLEELFLLCDVVFTSNGTSAAVDAYCANIPVIQVLDPNTLNMSPLRGLTGVKYVTGAAELVIALDKARQPMAALAEPYFCLDDKLPRWRKLLEILSVRHNE
jgi:surface carbohydrate biosynthesis protein (TIGR04326 family)